MKQLISQLLASLLALATLGLAGCATSKPMHSDSRIYEMRIYYSPAGRLDDLHARFRNHTLKLFAKHGIESIGYWVPVENPENQLIYLLAYPSREARDKSWKEFMADTDWQAVRKETEAKGPIVSRVTSYFLQATDYSPRVKTGDVSHGGVFELRTYTTGPGLLPNLDERFRDHTVKLFEKHGMHNYGYWHKTSDQPDSNVTLIYLLTHKSPDAAKASFDAFRQDPAWTAAKEASEKKAGGSLTVKDGVKSVFLKPTDYSPTR
jgi:hypothetical protein